MNITEPAKRRSEKTRLAILDAAEVVFSEHGFDGARIDAIAEASGLSSLQRRLEQSFQSSLNLRVPVRLLPPGSLPRFEMKAMRWSKLGQ